MGCRSLESPMPTGAGHRAALLVHLLLLLFCHSLIFHLFILYSLEGSLLGPFSLSFLLNCIILRSVMQFIAKHMNKLLASYFFILLGEGRFCPWSQSEAHSSTHLPAIHLPHQSMHCRLWVHKFQKSVSLLLALPQSRTTHWLCTDYMWKKKIAGKKKRTRKKTSPVWNRKAVRWTFCAYLLSLGKPLALDPLEHI